MEGGVAASDHRIIFLEVKDLLEMGNWGVVKRFLGMNRIWILGDQKVGLKFIWVCDCNSGNIRVEPCFIGSRAIYKTHKIDAD